MEICAGLGGRKLEHGCDCINRMFSAGEAFDMRHRTKLESEAGVLELVSAETSRL